MSLKVNLVGCEKKPFKIFWWHRKYWCIPCTNTELLFHESCYLRVNMYIHMHILVPVYVYMSIHSGSHKKLFFFIMVKSLETLFSITQNRFSGDSAVKWEIINNNSNPPHVRKVKDTATSLIWEIIWELENTYNWTIMKKYCALQFVGWSYSST